MQLSRELKERLESDPELLQKSAVHLLRAVSTLYNLSPEEMSLELKISPRTLVSWLTGSPPTLLECGMIFLFAEQQLLPVEWEIRGLVLGEYDDKERVPLIREFIGKVVQRLRAERFAGEKDSRELNLLVSEGTLALYQLGSFPGSFRIFLGIRQLGEDLYIQVGRVELEQDISVGGDIQIHLPTEPKAVNVSTISYYIPGADHTFTINDWKEMNHWLESAEIVDPKFYLNCYMLNLVRVFPREQTTAT